MSLPEPAPTHLGEPPAPDEVLRVVAGDATDEEVVALVTALAAVATRRTGGPPPADPSRWADRAALVGAPLTAAPGAWRASAWRR